MQRRRPRRAAARDRRRRRDPGPLGHQGRRRGARCRAAAQGRRPCRCRPGQRRREGRDPERRHGRQRADLQHRPAAELAVALMLAAARHVAPANAALKNGEWKRSKYTGIELYEKTVGIVGLGRIGVLVAQRLSAFGMKVIAYDPYVQAGRAAQMGVRLVRLDELLAESDFMSVHLPKTPETLGPDRRGAAGQGQADPGAGQRRPRRHRRRAGALQRLQGGPHRRGRARRVRQGAVHRQPAVRARERRRHPAPRRLDRRGPGEGRHRGRAVGPAGAQRRAGARRGQRPGRASSPRTCGPASR